jgi:hypothetical protein
MRRVMSVMGVIVMRMAMVMVVVRRVGMRVARSVGVGVDMAKVMVVAIVGIVEVVRPSRPQYGLRASRRIFHRDGIAVAASADSAH